ncbi:MAG TPA: MOSC domain-containing protein [Candidatus Lustribacter sp.]|jgi:MOSC domain-containing protein YiiM|nr:MOSC domain-containing protein [Candidatus Lustribacter sp.]
MPAVISVNVGKPRSVEWNGQRFTTAIVKRPVQGSRLISGVNVEGDDQADRRVHGGENKAVYAYAAEDYAWWSQELGREIKPASFGENITVSGVDLSELQIGERWRVGTALLEVSEPRVPCFKLGYAMEDPRFLKQFALAMRYGTYFRIIEPGTVEAGSPMAREAAAPESAPTTREAGRLILFGT